MRKRMLYRISKVLVFVAPILASRFSMYLFGEPELPNKLKVK